MNYTSRLATPDDIGVLVRHRELMFREMGWECDYADMATCYGRWLEDAIPNGHYSGWVVTPEGEEQIVAGAGVIVVPWIPGPQAMDPRLAWIVNVYTDSPHRHRGIARRLMQTMHEWCQSQGIERIALNASSEGQPIYESMGYELAQEPMMRYRVT